MKLHDLNTDITARQAEVRRLEMQFWRAIGQARRDRGLTQKEVACRLDIERAAYANYEIGRRTPDPELRQQLIDLFGGVEVGP